VKELLPDIPRIYTALAEWLACMTLLLPRRQRQATPLFYVAAAGALGVQALFLQLTADVPVAWWIPCMAFAVCLMFLLLWLGSGLNAAAAGYLCAWAFVLAEFAASLQWQLFCLLLPGAAPLGVPSLVCMAAGYAVIYGVEWNLNRTTRRGSQPLIGTGALVSAVLMAGAVFAVSNLGFVTAEGAYSGVSPQGIYYIRTLVDLAGLLILSLHYRQMQDAALRAELAAMDHTLHRQYDQYKQSKENIRLLNRRYHDLKMQVAAIRAERDPGEQAQLLDELESGLAKFEAENKTGNPVLDTILTTKSLYCAQHGITLTCVADGRLLDFLSAMEISTIFGTLLDNAVDSVRPLEKERRLIRLAVFAQKGFLMIRCENTYAGVIDFNDGLPVSAKPAEQRSYGLKSVRTVAEKYGGSMTAHTEDGWFYARVLLPVQAE